MTVIYFLINALLYIIDKPLNLLFFKKKIVEFREKTVVL